MSWLERYTRYQLRDALSVVEQYQRGQTNYSQFMRELSEIFDIWSLEPDAWSDTLLIEWAALFETFSTCSANEAPQLSDEAQRRLAVGVSTLQSYLEYLNYLPHVQTGLSSIEAYLDKHLSVRELMGRLWQVGSDLRVWRFSWEEIPGRDTALGDLFLAFDGELEDLDNLIVNVPWYAQREGLSGKLGRHFDKQVIRTRDALSAIGAKLEANSRQ